MGAKIKAIKIDNNKIINILFFIFGICFLLSIKFCVLFVLKSVRQHFYIFVNTSFFTSVYFAINGNDSDHFSLSTITFTILKSDSVISTICPWHLYILPLIIRWHLTVSPTTYLFLLVSTISFLITALNIYLTTPIFLI